MYIRYVHTFNRQHKNKNVWNINLVPPPTIGRTIMEVGITLLINTNLISEVVVTGKY